MKESKIITLGFPRAGKTNYIEAAIAYMAKHGCGEWQIHGNSAVDETIDEVELQFRKGRWMDKTDQGTKKEYIFEIPCCWWKFRDERRVTVCDWAGESYEDCASVRNGEDNTNADFRNDCRQADGFMIFGDPERFFENSEEDGKERGILRRIMQEVVEDGKKRSFAIVITKTDTLPKDYFSERGKLNLSKVINIYDATHGSMWSKIKGRGYPCGIFPVSLLPKEECWKDTMEVGRIPSERWSLEEVMESSCVDIPERCEEQWQWYYYKRWWSSVAAHLWREEQWQWYYYKRMYGAFQWLLDSLL